MAWKTLDRIQPVIDPNAAPLLSEALREKIRSFFRRYETRRAALLPALHIVQHAHGHVNYQAMKEVAELLEIHPSDVMDVVSFYTHFSSHPRGQKTILVCRSLSCELMGGKEVLETLKTQLGIEEHGTTADGRYTLMTEECLAACDHAPCMLVNERMHKSLKGEDVASILADSDNDNLAMPRSDLFDPPPQGVSELETTSDVAEMTEAKS
jgi:NADH-quinone oxidoreductase subunit E